MEQNNIILLVIIVLVLLYCCERVFLFTREQFTDPKEVALLSNLKEKNFWVYGFDGKGKKDFTDIDWKGNNILLFGSEGFGMHQHTSKYADFLVRIDINQKVESLNISNSAAIVFHYLDNYKN